MTEIKFTIKGNQENPDGNPIGYHRTTQRAKWAPEHQRYEAWKEHVQQACNRSGYTDQNNLNIKPIKLTPKQKARVDIEIEYASEAQPDNDNVFKGILDALFVNDKYVTAGSFVSKQSKTRQGKVEVIIKII